MRFLSGGASSEQSASTSSDLDFQEVTVDLFCFYLKKNELPLNAAVAGVDPRVAPRRGGRLERHHRPEEQAGHQGSPAARRGALPRLQVGAFPTCRSSTIEEEPRKSSAFGQTAHKYFPD